MEKIKQNLLTGLLTIIPIWVSAWVVWFILDLLVRTGRPFVLALSRLIEPHFDEFADLLAKPWFQSTLALTIVFGGLYVLGAATKAVIGRRILRFVHGLLERVPLVKTIYGATRTLIESTQGGAQGGQRVVLIEFPTPEMRAVGFVTRMFHAADTGEELAAVYVPTTPNPTSGYVEIVPTARLVWLDWTSNEAMSFIVSGGALAPDNICIQPNGRDIRFPGVRSEA